MSGIVFVCTANRCRSVMAERLLSARLADRGVAVTVTSAGLCGGGLAPPDEAVAVMRAHGLDVTGHRSRAVAGRDLAAAGLIIGLAREHVRHCVVLEPAVWPRAFTLRELVRRTRVAGPRAPGEQLGRWLAGAAAGRARADLLGRGEFDDVPDPYPGPSAGYRAVADLLDELTAELASLGWGEVPVTGGPRPRSG
jgi:protein-tyrosine phosphatase